MPFYIIIIIISFFASLLGMTAKENRRPPLLFFPFFLLVTILVEYFGEKMSMQNRNNILLYNCFTIFEFFFYFVFFWFLFTHALIKKIVLVVIIVYLFFAFLNIFFVQGKTHFNTYTYVIGCTVMVTLSVTYFYLLFRFPDTTGSLIRNPYFWLVTGLIFFYTCTFSLYGLENFITKTMQQYSPILFFVSDILNILLYTSFSIGFLCKINIRKLLGLS